MLNQPLLFFNRIFFLTIDLGIKPDFADIKKRDCGLKIFFLYIAVKFCIKSIVLNAAIQSEYSKFCRFKYPRRLR